MNALDFSHAEFINNPYPIYQTLLASDAPYFLPLTQKINSSGIWLFSRYNDVVSIFKETQAVSKQISKVRLNEQHSILDLHLLNQDTAIHSRLRNTVKDAFTAKRIKTLEPKLEYLAKQLIDSMREQGEVDFISAFAQAFPITVISDLIGIAQSDYHKIQTWSADIRLGFDSILATSDDFKKQAQALAEISDYFNDLIKHYQQNPSDNLISHLIQTHEDHKHLNYNEMLSMLIILLIAGHETTVNLLGNGLLILLQHPEQFALLKSQPEYINSAIEEILRFESPAQRTTFRITTAPIKINGHTIEAGQQIAGLIGAANRDYAYFKNPNTFDITRNPNPHLAFGLGTHACLGSFLARAEARIAFKEILLQLPNIALGSSAHQWNRITFFRSLQSLPIRC